VITFLAVAGEPIEPPSTPPLPSASTPALPAEKVTVRSRWLQTNWSAFALSAVYSPATSLPQEFECTRAPATQACWKSCRMSVGIPVR